MYSLCWHCNLTIEKTKGMRRTLGTYSSDLQKKKEKEKENHSFHILAI